MEIIQQRLIWLLGTASLLFVLFRLTANRFDMPRITLAKIKIGLGLLLFGAVTGIIGRLGFMNQALVQSGLVFYLENIIGCLGGWCLILWGIVEWAGDGTGTSISASRSRAYTEILAQTVIREHSAEPFLSRIAKYLTMAIDCDALSLHFRKGNGRFGLQFEYGFGRDLARTIANPSSSSPVASAAGLGEAVVLDTPEEIHADGLVATANGPVTKCISVPLNNGSAVLTAYYSKSHGFGQTDLEIMTDTTRALASCIRRDSAERARERQAREKELQRELSALFEAEIGLYSPLIKSARLLGEHFQLAEMNLYIGGDGAVQSYDFEITADFTLRIKTGYFAKAKFPFLNKPRAASQSERHITSTRDSVIVSGITTTGRCFWLEAKLSNSDEEIQAPAALMDALSDLISRRLSEEDTADLADRYILLLGALRHLQEMALSGVNVSTMMQEAAQVVVETGLYPFCRVTLCDPGKTRLKTAALAEVRPLTWQLQHIPSVSLDRAPLHMKALQERTAMAFELDSPESGMAGGEACLLLPEGARRGMVVPILLDGNAVGALTAGDFRDAERTNSAEPGGPFLSDIAGLISLLLTWHKERRASVTAREGQKRLTMIKPEGKSEPAIPRFSPGVRSRINGPLAGILASCEYLKESCPNIDQQVGRYLSVIEKNAERIHAITSGLAGK